MGMVQRQLKQARDWVPDSHGYSLLIRANKLYVASGCSGIAGLLQALASGSPVLVHENSALGYEHQSCTPLPPETR